jgi:hypothetical protein
VAIFVFYFTRSSVARQYEDDLKKYFNYFEEARVVASAPDDRTPSLFPALQDKHARWLIAVYTDRSSFRVSDVSSVILRDVVLWQLFFRKCGSRHTSDLLPAEKFRLLRRLDARINKLPEPLPEPDFAIQLEAAIDFEVWGAL